LQLVVAVVEMMDVTDSHKVRDAAATHSLIVAVIALEMDALSNGLLLFDSEVSTGLDARLGCVRIKIVKSPSGGDKTVLFRHWAILLLFCLNK